MEKKVFRKSVQFITLGDEFIFNKPIKAPNLNQKKEEKKPQNFIIPDNLKLNKLVCDDIENKQINRLEEKIDNIKIPEIKIPNKFKQLEIDSIKNKSIESESIICNKNLFQKGAVVLINMDKKNIINPIDLIEKKIIKVNKDFGLCSHNQLINKMPIKMKGLFFRLHLHNVSDKDVNIKDGKNFKIVGSNKVKAKSINEYYLNCMKTRSELIILNEYQF
tara:strand:- start:181 stop:837 length:657 start_codon:yes stop_codon:yes gene_type:complete